MRNVWILVIGLVLVILTAGCTGSSPSLTPIVTPTPQIVYVTVLVTPTPTTPPPTVTPTSLKYSGNGDEVKSFSVSGGGGFIVSGSYSGAHNFIVEIDDNNGEMVELPFNEIGTYTGQTVINLGAGKYFLSVKASGPWTVDISPT